MMGNFMDRDGVYSQDDLFIIIYTQDQDNLENNNNYTFNYTFFHTLILECMVYCMYYAYIMHNIPTKTVCYYVFMHVKQ